MITTPEDIARAVTDLAAMPEVCSRLLTVVNDERATLDDIARVIGSDPALAARVLRLANSPFYGQERQVADLGQAMMVTGTQAVVSLVLASCSVQALNRLPQAVNDPQQFWEHSAYASALARALARRHRRCAAEQAFLAGLLHDIGLLALAAAAPEMATVLEVKRHSWPGPSHRLEESWMGFHHGQVGAALLDRWHFPRPLILAVSHHHDPIVEDAHAPLMWTVHVADLLAHRAGWGREGRDQEPGWPEHVMVRLGLEEAQIREAMDEAGEQLSELMRFILPAARAA